jgi:glycosyltransferase involved in cell wall biosynthesis
MTATSLEAGPGASPVDDAPLVAVDLRALVPEATGIGVYTRSLLAALAARPEPLRYIGMAHAEPRGAAAVAAAGIPVEVQPAPLGVWWQQRTLPRRLARGDVDLLFSPLQTLPLSCPVPAVVTVHDLTVLLRPEDHRFKVRWSQIPFLARSLARARRVIAVSRATADDLLFQFPECRGKVRVIHEGVAPEFRPAAPEEIERIRGELGAPRGYLLFVGTLEPRKNLATLLTAWEALAAADPDFPPLLLAGGEGWHSRSLRRRIAALAPLGLRHVGRVEDRRLVELFQGATAFVYPSLYEGFGLPVLEAMACGVPCVTSDVSSLPEVAGRAALTVDPRDAAALAAAVSRLVTDRALAAALAARGVERAAGFTWERAAAETEETLREALQAPDSAVD